MLDINKKIEEIRRKPEHERMRYVWGSVAVCMVFVFLVWILSVKISLQKNAGKIQPQNIPDISQQLQDIKKATPSISDLKQITNQDYGQQPPANTQNSAQSAQ
jgi:Tfp pilus assembly protein PilN